MYACGISSMAASNRLLPTMGGSVEAVDLENVLISVVGVSQETAPKNTKYWKSDFGTSTKVDFCY